MNLNFSESAVIIDGKGEAEKILASLKEDVFFLKNLYGITPSVALIMIGDNEASKIYVNLKAKKCKEIGIESRIYHFAAGVDLKEVIYLINSLNEEKGVNGILLQLPLPSHIDTFSLLKLISPQKDVDCLTPYNIGLLNLWTPYLEPCTPQGVLLLIKKILGNNISGKKAVVIGRSSIVGRPMATMLLKENCSISVLHSYSNNLIYECKTADILVIATGQALLVKRDWIKENACVIDVGISRIGGVICGDVDFNDLRDKPCHITPVPGGVGPMTIACLLRNTVKVACSQNGISDSRISI